MSVINDSGGVRAIEGELERKFRLEAGRDLSDCDF